MNPSTSIKLIIIGFLLFFFVLTGLLSAHPAEHIRLPLNTELLSADRDFKQAKELKKSGNYAESINYYEKAASKYKKYKVWGKYVQTLNKISFNYRLLKRYKETLNTLNTAMPVALKQLGENHPELSSVYNNLGLYYYEKYDYTRASSFYRKSLIIDLKVFGENHPNVAAVYGNIGNVYDDLGDYSGALEYHQKALNILLKTFGKYHPDVANSYNNTGSIFWTLGDYLGALAYFEKALKIRLKVLGEDHPHVATSYSNIGAAYRILGNYPRALEYYQKAPVIFLKKLGENHPNLAGVYANMSTVYRDISDYSRALEYSQKALNIMLKTLGENHVYVARIYENMGIIHTESGNYERALVSYQKALVVRLKVLGDDHPFVADAYGNMGITHSFLGNNIRALGYYQKALTIQFKSFKKDHPTTASIYVNMGTLYLNTGNYTLASEYYQKALVISLKTFGTYHYTSAKVYGNMSDIRTAQGDYRRALKYNQKAFSALVKGFDNTDIYVNPPLREINSNPEMLEQLRKKSLAAEKLYLLSKQQKDLDLSYSTASLAADLIDTMRNSYESEEVKQRVIKESFSSVYERGIRTGLKLYNITKEKNYPLKAFNLSERSKSYLLYQSLKESEAKQFSNIPDSLLEKEHDLKVNIAFYEKKLAELHPKKDSAKLVMYQDYLFEDKRTFEKLIKQLEADFADYYRLKYDTQTAAVKDVQSKLLDENTALIEYFWGDSTVYAFTVTKDSFELHAIGHPDSLGGSISRLRKHLETPSGTETDEAELVSLSHDLYKRLIPKSIDKNKALNRLIILPDGPLSRLPFDVLLTRKDDRQVLRSQLLYLLKRFTVSYGYSATLMLQQLEKTRKKPEGECLAFAPTYGGKPLAEAVVRGPISTLRGKAYSDLPGAQKEIRKLSGLLQGNFYFGRLASENRFKKEAGNYTILHLAMHGEIDEKQPMNSKLVFSQEDTAKEDGFLHAYELYNMNLNTELAVLSACQTGTGQFVRGEGVMSLARGFFYAGVGSVVMSLWEASDESTAILTENFYKALKEGKRKDEALKEAKQEYLKSIGNDPYYSHPYFWSAFVPAGDMKPLTVSQNSMLWVWWIAGSVIFLAGTNLLVRRNKKTGRKTLFRQPLKS